MNTTLADPNIPDLSPVMSSPEIVSHVQNAFSSLPAPVQDAIDHAHGLLSVAKTAQAEPAPNTSAMPAPESNESPFAGIKLPMGRATGDGNPRMVGQTVKSDTINDIPFSGPKFAPYNPQTGENYGNNPALHDLIERPGTEKTAITPLPNARADQPTDPTLLAKAEGGIAPPSVPQIAATPALPVAAPEMAAPAVVAPPPSVTPAAPSRVVPAPSWAAQDLQRMQTEGSPVNRIHNPFLRIGATIGDVIGSGLFPGFAQFIPGTSARHQSLVAQREQQVTDEAAEQKARDESATANATQHHLGAESEELQHRQKREDAQAEHLANDPNWEQSKELMVDPAHPELGKQVVYVSKKDPTQKRYVGAAAPKDPTNEVEAWLQDPKHKGRSMEQFWDEKAKQSGIQKEKPLTKETAATLNSAWNSLAPKYHLAADPFREGMSDSEVKHVQDSMNAIVQRNQGAQNITINQEKADAAAKRDPSTEKEYKSVHDDLNKKFATAETQLQSADQALSEINSGAMGQAFGTIKSLVTLAGGQGSGVRITQAELNSIANARGIKGTFEGWINSLEGKGKLSGDQVAQLNAILAEAKRKGEEKRTLLSSTLDKLSDAKSTAEIRAIEKEYRDSGSSSTIPTVKDKAEYDKLKSGSVYIGPDGKKATKK